MARTGKESLLIEIDKTLEVLKARIPASLENPENQKLQKRLQRDMENYFRALDTALPFDRLEGLYYKWVKPE